jgi:phosphohistidine phosphatase
MALYLVQHGLSLPREVDPDPGLSPEGVAQVQRIAGVARGYGVSVARILHSGKKRAEQTAAILAAALEPSGGVDLADALGPLDPVSPWAPRIRTEHGLMLVGHLPFMERLTSLLVIGAERPMIFKFQNGGIVCLDRNPEASSLVVKWALMPNIS